MAFADDEDRCATMSKIVAKTLHAMVYGCREAQMRTLFLGWKRYRLCFGRWVQRHIIAMQLAGIPVTPSLSDVDLHDVIVQGVSDFVSIQPHPNTVLTERSVAYGIWEQLWDGVSSEVFSHKPSLKARVTSAMMVAYDRAYAHILHSV